MKTINITRKLTHKTKRGINGKQHVRERQFAYHKILLIEVAKVRPVTFSHRKSVSLTTCLDTLIIAVSLCLPAPRKAITGKYNVCKSTSTFAIYFANVDEIIGKYNV